MNRQYKYEFLCLKLYNIMNNELQFKIIRGKISFGGNNQVQKIKQIIDSSKEQQASKCEEVRILHCPKLTSIEGIQICKNAKQINLSSNSIQNLLPLKSMIALQILDVKANCLKSLKGIDCLRNLTKIDASQNKIQSLEGFAQSNSQIQTIILFKNNIKDINQLKRLNIFTSLKQVCFEKTAVEGRDRSNPFCQNKEQYYEFLKENLNNSRNSLEKIDDLSPQSVKNLFSMKRINYQERNTRNNIPKNITNYNTHQKNNSSDYFDNNRHQNTQFYGQTNLNPLNSQKLMLMTQRQTDLQRIIDLKEEAIDQLKLKNHQLEITNSNQFKESIKRQAEYERLAGQISELSRHVDQKDAKINQLHRRIEDLFKTNSAANNLSDTRAAELEKMRREYNDLKIQNAQLRVLNKDQQNRLRQLQNKTLINIEDKSLRIQDLRRKNEELMIQNYQIKKQQDQYKDRVRQLTQLLQQWQYKYQQKIKEIAVAHNNEKGEIIAQLESKINQNQAKYQEHIRKLNIEFEDKIRGLQQQYSAALENALEKYSRLKRNFDEKAHSESQIKLFLKSIMAKNTEYESHLKQYEQVVISSRKSISNLAMQNESLIKQCYEIKSRSEAEIKHLNNQLSKQQYLREKLDREARELRQSNQYLQKNFDNLNYREKQLQELFEKNQNLQTAVDAKTVMLDDKNDTIQSLKTQLQDLQKDLQARVDSKQFEKLNQKYRRQKDILKSYEEQINKLTEQNKELSEKVQIYGNLQAQFSDFRDIISKQQSEIKEKNENIGELIESLQKLKKYTENIKEQTNILRNQKNKLINTLQEKEIKWNKTWRDKENEYERNIGIVKEEMTQYKTIAQKLKNFTKNLNF